MAQTATVVTGEVAKRLQSEAGLPFAVSAISERDNISLGELGADQVVSRNVAPDIAEKSFNIRYPAFYVYCERIVNDLAEKFRTFSGAAAMCVEVRVSHDRMDDIERRLQSYVEAVTDVLDANRGTWPNGMYYGGKYEVAFGALKHGGKNFLQAAKVRFDVNISSD